MSFLEYVKVQFDRLLVLTKDLFKDHLERLKEVLAKVLQACLRVNAEKSIFFMDTIKYLGYLLTHERLKPFLQKTIHALQPLVNIKK